MLYNYNMSSEEKDNQVFKALAAPIRRRILDALRDAPKTTGELCATFTELDRCTVMQHLRVLERAELVIANKIGRQRWNHLNAIPIKRIHERWIGGYARSAVELVDDLKTGLEEDQSQTLAPERSEG